MHGRSNSSYVVAFLKSWLLDYIDYEDSDIVRYARDHSYRRLITMIFL
jgi:hemerythrin